MGRKVPPHLLRVAQLETVHTHMVACRLPENHETCRPLKLGTDANKVVTTVVGADRQRKVQRVVFAPHAIQLASALCVFGMNGIDSLPIYLVSASNAEIGRDVY